MKISFNLPENWKVIKVPDILFFQEGPGVRKWQFHDTGVKLVNVGNINNSKITLSKTKIHISEDEAYGKYAHFLIDEGDLLIACSGIVVSNFHNKIAFIEKEHLPLCLNTSTMRFKALDEKFISLNFFRYFLQTNTFTSQLRKLITGSAQLNFGPSHIKKIDVPLPPLAEQQKIAAILDAADSLRQKDQQLIEHYTALSQSLFLEMFGDPVNNPMGWKKVKMGELVKIERGGSPRPIEKFLGGTYPWIKIGDATKGNGIYIEQTKEHIIEEGLNKTRLLSSGSIIFANCGVSLGFARILTFDGCIHDGWLSFSEINSDILNKLFILKTLNSITKYFRETAPDGTQPNLNTSIMKNFKFILPPITLQNQFAETIQAIEAQKQQAQASLEKSETLFNSLLQRAFKGELTA